MRQATPTHGAVPHYVRSDYQGVIFVALVVVGVAVMLWAADLMSVRIAGQGCAQASMHLSQEPPPKCKGGGDENGCEAGGKE